MPEVGHDGVESSLVFEATAIISSNLLLDVMAVSRLKIGVEFLSRTDFDEALFPELIILESS